MKTFKKLLIVLSALVMVVAIAALAGCSSTKKYTGEYGYVEYGTKYGVKVEVSVKDDKITGVKILDSDYVAATSEDHWDDKAIWDNGLANLLKSYEGKTVEEVCALKVEVKDNGAPLTSDDDVEVDYGNLVITGATMGSGRLLLAVQNALKNK